MGDRCTGACCREFVLSGIGHTPEEIDAHLRARAIEGTFIADMIIPLRPVEAGTLLPNGSISGDPPLGGGWIFTCRHFDEAAGNCTAYALRPRMCRSYPYGSRCEHGDRCTWDAAREGRAAELPVYDVWPRPDRAKADRRVHLVMLDDKGLPSRAGLGLCPAACEAPGASP